MIVKIGDNFYDSTKEPVLLILGEHEVKHLKDMEGSKRYCSFPEEYDVEIIRQWMLQVPDEIMARVNFESE